MPSLLDDSVPFERYQTYDMDDTFAPLYDGNYTTYDYDCTFTDRFTLPPLLSPIGTRSMNDPGDEDLKPSDTLAGSILVKKDSAILEEDVDSDECRIRRGTQFAINTLVPITSREYCKFISRLADPPATASACRGM